MNKYNVLLQVQTKETQEIKLAVEAKDKADAIAKAQEMYNTGDVDYADFVAIGDIETTLLDNSDEWLVEKAIVKKEKQELQVSKDDGVKLVERFIDGVKYTVLETSGTLTVEWLLAHPEHDEAHYLRHCGGISLEYKGFIIESFGEHNAYYNDEWFDKNPELIKAYRDDEESKLYFTEEGWLEIIEKADEDEQYAAVSSVKEAVADIDRIIEERKP